VSTKTFQSVDDETEFSHGYDRGNYAAAYEGGWPSDWYALSESAGRERRSQPYHHGMMLGYFSSYELNEVPDQFRDAVAALRAKHGEAE
jgi:hypothetical protein